jgi:hypothetical protein
MSNVISHKIMVYVHDNKVEIFLDDCLDNTLLPRKNKLHVGHIEMKAGHIFQLSYSRFPYPSVTLLNIVNIQ